MIVILVYDDWYTKKEINAYLIVLYNKSQTSMLPTINGRKV